MNARTLLTLTLPLALAAPFASAQVAKPAAPAPKTSCASVLKARVNLNKASLADLQCLPGVTRAIAKDIVINRPIKDAQDFQTKIELIGRKLWQQMGQYATF